MTELSDFCKRVLNLLVSVCFYAHVMG